MTMIETTTTTIEPPSDDFVINDAQLAAVAFLARLGDEVGQVLQRLVEVVQLERRELYVLADVGRDR